MYAKRSKNLALFHNLASSPKDINLVSEGLAICQNVHEE